MKKFTTKTRRTQRLHEEFMKELPLCNLCVLCAFVVKKTATKHCTELIEVAQWIQKCDTRNCDRSGVLNIRSLEPATKHQLATTRGFISVLCTFAVKKESPQSAALSLAKWHKQTINATSTNTPDQ